MKYLLIAGMISQSSAATFVATLENLSQPTVLSSLTTGIIQFSSPVGKFNAFHVNMDQNIGVGTSDSYTIESLNTHGWEISQIIRGYLESDATASNAAGAQLAIWQIVSSASLHPTLNHEDEILAKNDFLENIGSYVSTPVTFLKSTHHHIVTWTPIPEPSITILSILALPLFLRRNR